MDLINSIAEGAGAAFVNKLATRKDKGNNIFVNLFKLIKQLLGDPEKMELTITADKGDLLARVKPDKEENKGFLLRVSTFGD